MLQNEGFKLFFSEYFFVLWTWDSFKHLGPLGTALPPPRLLRHCLSVPFVKDYSKDTMYFGLRPIFHPAADDKNPVTGMNRND